MRFLVRIFSCVFSVVLISLMSSPSSSLFLLSPPLNPKAVHLAASIDGRVKETSTVDELKDIEKELDVAEIPLLSKQAIRNKGPSLKLIISRR